MSDKLCYIVKSSHVDTKKWEWVLKYLIKEVAQERGFRCEVGNPFGDKFYRLDRDIAKLIQADLVVIDVTGCDDPTVFYQLGVRHARANRTLLIAQDEESLEEDVASFHKITYSSDAEEDYGGFCQEFARVLDELAAHPQEPDNAVQKYLRGEGRTEKQEKQMKEQAQLIARLQKKINSLEEQVQSTPSSPQSDDRIEFKRVS